MRKDPIQKLAGLKDLRRWRKDPIQKLVGLRNLLSCRPDRMDQRGPRMLPLCFGWIGWIDLHRHLVRQLSGAFGHRGEEAFKQRAVSRVAA